jgi:hypothetical protein
LEERKEEIFPKRELAMTQKPRDVQLK